MYFGDWVIVEFATPGIELCELGRGPSSVGGRLATLGPGTATPDTAWAWALSAMAATSPRPRMAGLRSDMVSPWLDVGRSSALPHCNIGVGDNDASEKIDHKK